MTNWRAAVRKMAALFRRRDLDRQLDDELRFHIERETERNVGAGIPPDEARRRALLEFGGVEQVKEEVRDSERFTWLEWLLQDVRFALRMLRKNPGFTTVAIITLALGIGANTAIFNVVNAVLLNRLPFKDPDRLVVLQEATSSNRGFGISAPNFEDYGRQQTTFADLSMWAQQSVNLTGGERPERVTGSFVSANFFRLLGVEPARGRFFLPGEDRPEAQRVTIISYSTWQTRFGGDPNIIGRQLILNGEPKTVVGILPQNFLRGELILAETDVYLSIRDYPNYKDERAAKNQLVVGRLKPGVSTKAAAADLNVITQRLARDYPDENSGIHIELTPVKELQVESVRPALLILLAAVSLVLLIACANLANLLLARGAARAREIAIRSAIGASRSRIVRQLVSESIVVSLLGGAAGLFLAWWGLEALLKVNPVALPVNPVGLDLRVLLFAVVLSISTGILFGIVPALQLTRTGVAGFLSSGGRSTSGAVQRRIRSAFVVCQIALSVVLLIGAGLLVRSFQSLLSVQPGFRTDNLLTMEYRLPRNIYTTPEKQWGFHRRMLEEVRQVPGVVAAGLIQGLPFSGNGGRIGTWPAEQSTPEKGKEPTALSNLVDPEYFNAVGLPILLGRNFNDHDTSDAPTTVVINQTLARKYWPGQDPIGRELRFPETVVAAAGVNRPARATVIGVVPDTRQFAVKDPFEPQVYFAYAQVTGIFGTLVVRTATDDPMSLSEDVRKAVWKVDKDQPVWKVRTVEMLIERNIAPDRFVMLLMGLFGVLALVLTAVGTYGVISFGVTQRTQEIGVRMALGATPGSILKLVMNGGVLLVGIGGVLGLMGAFAATRAMTTLLFGVSPSDPATFAGVVIVLAMVALFATYLPARRATRVDPMVALRYE